MAVQPICRRTAVYSTYFTPRDRPSFDDIFREFETAGFEILPNADASAIKEAVSRVIAAEQSAS
jgi:hypothetical protein